MTREKTAVHISRTLAQYSADAKLLDERYADLLKRHPWCYVGVHNSKLFVGFTFAEVLAHFGDGEHIVIRHLNPHTETRVRVYA